MLHVKWGRDVLHFPIPPLDTPLGALRADLAAYTHLPAGSFKLVYKGAVMKEDSAPLSAYKLKENATIALIGGDTTLGGSGPGAGGATGGSEARASGGATTTTTTTAAAAKKKMAPPQTEAGTIVAIRAELERVRATLVPDVERFVGAMAAAGGAKAGSGSGEGSVGEGARSDAGPATAPTLLDHARLSELLLQSLLRLDAMCAPGTDWPEARVQRKAAVREVQGVLDRLDGAWAAR